ncbi:protein SEEDLING PLASTID DEVELOPMENT 1 isoform X1 [Vicia villosa]|uniref:protein SEEDLING PLASTID DEVELOPMENT 1 isoform X1 n=2 Tax=Vicia villosa TaxID=3911 RepID=UPI00273B6C1C|nr:protein SEEDLING PLASTID DEVELOPMENT 1 isoform X1 [Vicia villosa]
MLLRLPLPLHLPRRNEHHQPLLHNSVPPKRFNYHIFSHPQSTSPTVPVLRATYPVDLSSPSSFSEDEQDVELGRLLSLLPEEMRRRVSDHPELQQLMEVVMDLGRKPLARFPSGDFVISEYPITVQDIQHATAQVGDFAVDNRAGISRTLHRISAIRNRKGTIIGLTCRVGRAISGSAKLLQDLVQDGASLLLIGPPGVGKTTIIREVARMLANDYKKRVMIVDTSNEIGGDGDIPHSGIGSARRMQVPNSDMQHKVLIEAVENHMPQVIVIDEIGTKLEAMAASTIAQRGIQLVATAHGITIENLIMNPSLEMLVGGIQSVTLGDEEASRRGVQKTVLERKGPSTFSCAVEIISKTQLRIHRSLEATVDAILSGRVPNVEVRKMKSQEQEEILQKGPVIDSPLENGGEIILKDAPGRADVQTRQDESPLMSPIDMLEDSWEHRLPLRLFCYGILEATVIQGIKQLKMNDADLQLTDNISEANALLALQSKLKKNSRIQAAFKSNDVPIYVTKTSSLENVTKAIRALLSDYEDGLIVFGSLDKIKDSEKADALEEARMAIEHVVIPKGEPVDLLPRSYQVVSLQLELVRTYQLEARRIRGESDVHYLRILPSHYAIDEVKALETSEFDGEFDDEFDDLSSSNGNANGSPNNSDRLPILPE